MPRVGKASKTTVTVVLPGLGSRGGKTSIDRNLKPRKRQGIAPRVEGISPRHTVLDVF